MPVVCGRCYCTAWSCCALNLALYFCAELREIFAAFSSAGIDMPGTQAAAAFSSTDGLRNTRTLERDFWRLRTGGFLVGVPPPVGGRVDGAVRCSEGAGMASTIVGVRSRMMGAPMAPYACEMMRRAALDIITA